MKSLIYWLLACAEESYLSNIYFKQIKYTTGIFLKAFVIKVMLRFSPLVVLWSK